MQTDLRNIEISLRNQDYGQAQVHFVHLLGEIRSSHYLYSNISEEERDFLYNFPKQLPPLFLSYFTTLLKQDFDTTTTTTKEMFAFLLSEFYFVLDKDTYQNDIHDLKRLFPLNPDLIQTCANYLIETDLQTAITLYSKAVQLNPHDDNFKVGLFYAELKNIQDLKRNEKIDDAISFCENILVTNKYSAYRHRHNKIYEEYDRLKDYKVLAQKINSIDDKIKTEVEKERFKMIEILGFFSAIVAFILSTVKIGEKFSFIENLLFLIALGLILGGFCVCMSMLFNKSSTLKASKKQTAFLIVLLSTFIVLLFLCLKITLVATAINFIN